MENKIKILVVKPYEQPQIVEINNTLGAKQEIVEGYIEILYPYDDVCIVCNEEGKINGMDPCRPVFDKKGKLLDIIYGPFFLCGTDEEDFCSLNDEQMNKYMGIFSI